MRIDLTGLPENTMWPEFKHLVDLYPNNLYNLWYESEELKLNCKSMIRTAICCSIRCGFVDLEICCGDVQEIYTFPIGMKEST